MVHYFFSVKAHRRAHLLLGLLLLLSPALLPCIRLALGKPLSEAAQMEVGEGKDEMVEGSMIGSRPPRCVGICRTCGTCEAVQVPAIPPQQRNVGGKKFSVAMNTRGDYSSNYKPLSWKCKCGDVILNP